MNHESRLGVELARDPSARASWNDSWKTCGGGWTTGGYDPKTGSIFWGAANPAPDYDWSFDKWQIEGPRPGNNLYTSGAPES